MRRKTSQFGTIDVQLIGGADVKTSFDAGLWYGPNIFKAPNSPQLDQKLAAIQEGVATNGYLVPMYRNQTAFLYNPDKVANLPQTWNASSRGSRPTPKALRIPTPTRVAGQALVQAVIANLTGDLNQYTGNTNRSCQGPELEPRLGLAQGPQSHDQRHRVEQRGY